jgi:hypothetical protein
MTESNTVTLTESDAKLVELINSKVSQLSVFSPNPVICNASCNTVFPPPSPISYEGFVILIGIAKDNGLIGDKRTCENIVRDGAQLAAILTAISVDPAIISFLVQFLGSYCGDCACDRKFS